TGLVNADKIVMNQKSGDYSADGHVSSVRKANKKGKSSAMLSNDDDMQATASRMTSANSGKQVHYEGSAKAWQGANSVTADRLDIDQDKHVMEAHGRVVTQFEDKAKDGKSKGSPVFTVVHAPDLTYSDETRIAHYTGGVNMTRPDLTVDSRELTAFLKPSDADSSLDKA